MAEFYCGMAGQTSPRPSNSGAADNAYRLLSVSCVCIAFLSACYCVRSRLTGVICYFYWQSDIGLVTIWLPDEETRTWTGGQETSAAEGPLFTVIPLRILFLLVGSLKAQLYILPYIILVSAGVVFTVLEGYTDQQRWARFWKKVSTEEIPILYYLGKLLLKLLYRFKSQKFWAKKIQVLLCKKLDSANRLYRFNPQNL
jgi:hypothetical protein